MCGPEPRGAADGPLGAPVGPSGDQAEPGNPASWGQDHRLRVPWLQKLCAAAGQSLWSIWQDALRSDRRGSVLWGIAAAERALVGTFPPGTP